MTARSRRRLTLDGLRAGSPQTLGAVRMVPLLRERIRDDLRIAPRPYDALGVVSVDRNRPEEPGLKYVSFVPHGLVVSYTSDGSPVASLGASLGAPKEERGSQFVKLMHRMVKAEEPILGTERLRLLPLHLAVEGFLALHFRGPEILWREYSMRARRFGLDPRFERAVRGTWLSGFEEALRVFEIAPDQVGVLVFVAEALACAFVLPHPADYRRLHRSLLEDFFGELLLHYAMLYPSRPTAWEHLDASSARTVEDLARAVESVRAAWRDYAGLLASGLLGREVDVEVVRTMRAFTLERFLPVYDPDEECHIGERIVRDDGSIEYMKTFRLSAAQVRRAFLLTKLAEADWKIHEAAALLRTTPEDFILRVDSAGFGYLLNAEIQAALRRAAASR